MGKVRNFAAKLAHDTNREGQVFCPVCNTQIKWIKVIGNSRKKGEGGWTPRYEFVKVCKCTEEKFLAGKAE